MASGNIVLFHPFVFEPKTNSEEEEEQLKGRPSSTGVLEGVKNPQTKVRASSIDTVIIS